MEHLLAQLRHELTNYPEDRTPHGSGLGCLGLYRCTRPQTLHAVPLHMPCLMLVITGKKHLVIDDINFTLRPGEIVALPAGREFIVTNSPDSASQIYHGVALNFCQPVLDQFRQVHGARYSDIIARPKWLAPAPESLVAEMLQWLRWSRNYPFDENMVWHRQVTIMLLLAQAGLVGNLLLNHDSSWKRRVANLIHLDPSRSWGVRDVCERLGCSESSLRRHLQDEGSGFREILEEVRLAEGLALLQQTYLQIGTIAEKVGYQSQSRFGERFKRRFGLTPSDLRRTRLGDAESTLSSFPTSLPPQPYHSAELVRRA